MEKDLLSDGRINDLDVPLLYMPKHADAGSIRVVACLDADLAVYEMRFAGLLKSVFGFWAGGASDDEPSSTCNHGSKGIDMEPPWEV
jgi:hypothetical protein